MKKVEQDEHLYLLQNISNAVVYETPWPHAVLNNVFPKYVADLICDRFPEDILKRSNYAEAYSFMNEINSSLLHPWFKKFNLYNIDKTQDMHQLLLRRFNIKEQRQVKFGGIRYNSMAITPKPNLLRDWHVDNEEKCWQILVYFYKEPVEEVEGGHIFLGDGNPPQNPQSSRKYSPVNNRAIIWRNTDSTFHKFYSSSNITRRTLNFFINYK